MPATWNAIYLGTFGTDIDPTEGNATVEDNAALVGQTFGGPGNLLAHNVLEVTAIDNSGFGTVLDTDTTNTPNDQISFDLGGGPQVTDFDSVARYDATLTYKDGTTDTADVTVFQDTDGNLFMASFALSETDRDKFEAKAIESISLDNFSGGFAGGMPINQTNSNFVCYVEGTRVLTPEGERAIETLRAGDLVTTADRGAQPIRWIRSSQVQGIGKQAPVHIRAGVLGRGLPQRDLLVSRQHRMLACSPIVSRMFGCPEVLIPAHRLTELPGVELATMERPVSYWHLLMENHEIIFAEGAPSESLLPGPSALECMGPDVGADLMRRFPWIKDAPVTNPARPIPSPARQRRLLERHAKNGKSLLMPQSFPAAA
ncbi:MAG: Hint domain-containing protein [Paracoccaceae bacterium]